MKFISFIILLIALVSLFLLISNSPLSKKPLIEDYEEYIVNLAGEESKSSLLDSGYKVATFSGGCFWCSEAEYEGLDGVIEVVSGYSGGEGENPSFEEVSSGETNFREAIQIVYDPKKVSYARLLEVYWKHIDPTDSEGQFADRGNQYTTAIYYHDQEQKFSAEKSKEVLEDSGKYKSPIVTLMIPFKNFYLAEEYHQDYSSNNPTKYNLYKKGSGRAGYIKETWGESKPELEATCSLDLSKLTPEQYKITQLNGTESPFDNAYWDNHEEGIYVDVISGEPLFSSTDKFDSGSGWPSFTKPIKEGEIVELEDNSLGMERTEIRSTDANSHLGHLFNDGPRETGGMRYCVNSASLRFIPKEKMGEEGYEEYLYLFED